MRLGVSIGTLGVTTLALFLLTGACPSQAEPPAVAQHDLRWYVHHMLVTEDRPLSYWDGILAQATAEANVLLEGASGPADVPCCARLASIGVEIFYDVDPERDLYQIHDSAEWSDLLSIGAAGSRAFLVDAIFYCGSPATFLGCGQTTSDCSLFPENAGMDRTMVVSVDAYETWDRLAATIAHEKGHNSCLSHSDAGVEDDADSCNLMRSSDGGACLTESQCDAFVAAANSASSFTCDCHTAAGSLAADSTWCITDEDTSGICSGGFCGEIGSDASATLFAPVGSAADFADPTDEWISLSALTGNWTESFPLESGIVPTGFAYGDQRDRIFAVAPSGSNLNDLYSINRATGAVTLVGSVTDFEEMVALAFDPGGSDDPEDDRLLALAIRTGLIDSSGTPTVCRSLLAIDPDDASATLLGHINQACSPTSPGLTGLAYDSSRQKLYAAAFFSSKLWEISLECSPYCLATGIDDCVLKDSCPDNFYLGRTFPGLAYSAGNDRLYLIGKRGTSTSKPRTELDTFDAETLRKTETLNIDGFSVGGLAAGPNPLPADTDGDGENDTIDNCPAISNGDQLDTDADLLGDVCDDDDDGDGWTDASELLCDKDPLDDLSTPIDSDMDGICNFIETDDDNDGIADEDDAFPLDASEDTDTDGDGIGDNADPCFNGAEQTGSTVCGLNDEGFLVQTCTTGGWTDGTTCTGTDVCVNSATQSGTTVCGLNDEGVFVQTCSSGTWADGTTCTGTDVCVNSATQSGTTVCGLNDEGFFVQTCSSGGWADGTTCTGTDVCVNSATQTGTSVCGLNDEGFFVQTCSSGGWADGTTCTGTDVCVNSTTQSGTTVCGLNDEGFFVQTCSSGGWVDDTTCTGTGVCVNSATQSGTTVCGLNDEGFFVQTCSSGAWADGTTCTGTDVCVNSATQTGTSVCGLNDEGFFVQTCSSGAWADGTTCTGTDVCVNSATQSGTTVCGLNGEGLLVQSCSSGGWVDGETCTGTDVCVNSATQTGTSVCGLNDEGFFVQTCSSGAWADGTTCTGTDVCVNSATQSGTSVCGLNGEGLLVQSCSSGGWVDGETCTGTDVCVNSATQTGTSVCGLNDEGFFVQTCSSGAWADGTTCTGTDVCVNSATQTGTSVCGLAGEGFLVQSCGSGAWIDSEECSSYDADNDGFTDEEEIEAGTDPLDSNSIPAPEPASVLLQLTALLTLAGLARRRTAR